MSQRRTASAVTVAIAAAMASLLAPLGCNDTTQPGTPATFSITGRVELVGRTDTSERWFFNADDVPVYLLQADSIVDSLRTTNGNFTWSGKPSGTYSVAAGRRPAPWVVSTPFLLADQSMTLTQPLTLGRPHGPTFAPNPFHCSQLVTLSVLTQGYGRASLSIWDYSLRHRVYADSVVVAGGAILHWNLICGAFGAVPGSYWLDFGSTITPLPGKRHWGMLVFLE